MNPRRTTAVALTAAVLMLSFAGCTTPEPTPSPTATATSTPTADPTTAPTREPVAAPKDPETALADANAAYVEFKELWFNFLATPELGPEYLDGYVLTDSRMATLVQDTYKSKVENKTSVSGEPFTWQLNAALSYAAPVTNNETGDQDPLGAMNLFGCSDNTSVSFYVDGVENTDVPKGSFPYQAVMVYSPATEGWLVTDENELTGQEGAPLC